MQAYYQNKPIFVGVYSRDNLPERGSTEKIKNGAFVINLDEYHDIGTHQKFVGSKSIITNFFRIQAYDTVMCCYFCIGFIEFIFNGNGLTDFTNLFSPNDFKKNDDIILNHFLTNL